MARTKIGEGFQGASDTIDTTIASSCWMFLESQTSLISTAAVIIFTDAVIASTMAFYLRRKQSQVRKYGAISFASFPCTHKIDFKDTRHDNLADSLLGEHRRDSRVSHLELTVAQTSV